MSLESLQSDILRVVSEAVFSMASIRGRDGETRSRKTLLTTSERLSSVRASFRLVMGNPLEMLISWSFEKSNAHGIFIFPHSDMDSTYRRSKKAWDPSQFFFVRIALKDGPYAVIVGRIKTSLGWCDRLIEDLITLQKFRNRRLMRLAILRS